MDANPTDADLVQACKRLFDLHESGYKRPRPVIKRRSAPGPSRQPRPTHLRATAGHWVI